MSGSQWLLEYTALSSSLWIIMVVLLAVALLYILRLWRHHHRTDGS